MHGVVVSAVADGLEAQQGALRRELERLRTLEVRLRREPTSQSWEGIARNAFVRELTVLRDGFREAIVALEEAIACTARARESSLGRVG